MDSCMDQIDAAYDVLLMDNMKQRMSGASDVAKSVRFADVPKPKKPKQVGAPEYHSPVCIACVSGAIYRAACISISTSFDFNFMADGH